MTNLALHLCVGSILMGLPNVVMIVADRRAGIGISKFDLMVHLFFDVIPPVKTVPAEGGGDKKCPDGKKEKHPCDQQKYCPKIMFCMTVHHSNRSLSNKWRRKPFRFFKTIVFSSRGSLEINQEKKLFFCSLISGFSSRNSRENNCFKNPGEGLCG